MVVDGFVESRLSSEQSCQRTRVHFSKNLYLKALQTWKNGVVVREKDRDVWRVAGRVLWSQRIAHRLSTT